MNISQDRPPTGRDECRAKDRFELESFVQSVRRQLVDEDGKSTGMVVGLTGPWGSGKTYVINWIEAEIHALKTENTTSRNFIILRFDPWRISGRDDLFLYFLRRLGEEITEDTLAKSNTGRSTKEGVNWLRKRWEDYKEERDKVKDITIQALDMQESGAGQILKVLMGQTAEGLFKSVMKRLQNKNLHVVCIVDDLDRLEDDEIRDVAALVKSVGNIPNVSYLLAYDPERVALALSGDVSIKAGLQYLEKIVQLQVRLPASPAELMRTYAYEALGMTPETPWHDVPWSDVQRVMHDLVPRIISTPRDVVRLRNLVLFRLLHAENLYKMDLLRFCALETRFPLLPERLSKCLHRCSIDGYRELMRRPEIVVEDSGNVLDFLLVSDPEAEHTNQQHPEERALLTQLLPALAPGGPDRIARAAGRLCYESSLRTVLNYHPSPDLLTPDQAKALLSSPENLAETLRSAAGKQVLRHAHLQLRTVYHLGISRASRQEFWRQLSIHFDADVPVPAMTSWSQFLDLSHVWARGVATGYIRDESVVADHIDQWLDDGYLHLPACFLYFACAALGCTGIPRKGEFSHLLPEDELLKIVARAAACVPDLLRPQSGEGKVVKSLYPIWLAARSNQGLERTRDILSNPRDERQTDLIVGLVYRTWNDKRIHGFDISKVIAVPSLLPSIRRFFQNDSKKPFQMQKAYRFVLDNIDGLGRTNPSVSAGPPVTENEKTP
ncbi:P-loop NTPase fold protein [Ensifer sp. 4252]|uniref:P-loop NTPase fold protein n=1 Tax=Ensifer sp. 4252 TaxID=3373915 RepID=UPI003D194FC5